MANLYYGIDPGVSNCAVVEFEPPNKIGCKLLGNQEDILEALEGMTLEWDINSQSGYKPIICIEKPSPMGAPLSNALVDTCMWAGKVQYLAQRQGLDTILITPQKIKSIVCGTSRAKDKDRRTHLIDLLGGTKKGEPCHGLKSHLWAALSVAVSAHYLLDRNV